MDLKYLVKFGLEESQEPAIKNPILREALEPRSMDQASLVDDLEPGALKDEMKGKFDPDQETYEEYLRRINLERPFNMNQGGRIGFNAGELVKPSPDGERQGYARAKGQKFAFDYERAAKRAKARKKGLIYDANTKKFRKTKAPTGTIPTPKQQQKIIDAFPGTTFDFERYPAFGVKKYLTKDQNKTNKAWAAVSRFKNKGYVLGTGKGLNVRGEPYSDEGKRLTKKQIEFVKSNFELPEGVKAWNFDDYRNKYGVKSTIAKKGSDAQYERDNFINRIRSRLKEKTPWTVAADRGSVRGWMMLQMNRLYKNQMKAIKLLPELKKSGLTYEPVYDIFDDGSKEGRKIIVGFKDNTPAGKGKVYYGLDKWAKKDAADWTKHGDWKLNQKLVDITKRSKNAPNEVIMGLLEDRGFKNLDGKLKLNHLIHFLSGKPGTSKQVIKNAIVRHHQSGVRWGSATNDLVLTTDVINAKIKGIERNISQNRIFPDDIKTLENFNVTVKAPDGKIYGGGGKTPIGQFKQIESSVAKALETGVDLRGQKFDNKKLLKFFKDAGIPFNEISKSLSVEDQTKLSKTIQSIMNKKNSGLNVVDIARWGSAELSALDDIAGKLPSKALGAFGKLLKVAGVASIPLDVVPFVQARDLGIDKWGAVGGKNLAETYANLPAMIWEAGEWAGSKLQGKDHEWKLPYEAKFGQRATAKALRETSVEDLIANIKAQGEAAQSTDMAYGQQLLDPLVSEEEINKRIEKALKLKAYYDSNPDVLPEKEEKKPTDNLTGVDKYILSNLDV